MNADPAKGFVEVLFFPGDAYDIVLTKKGTWNCKDIREKSSYCAVLEESRQEHLGFPGFSHQDAFV